MKTEKARITDNAEIARGFFRMGVESPYLARASRPGQFVEVRCSEDTEPLLRRPLGVHRIRKGGIDILYEVAGKGTELLSRKRRGDKVDIMGPLGNGFYLPATDKQQLTVILVAGGIGVAPLVALAEKLVLGSQLSGVRKNIKATIGARTKKHILCENDFKKIGCEVFISTDDGSRGKRGFVTDVLKELLPTTDNQQPTTIYACGPTPMLKAAASIAEAHKLSCQVSLEERMACGVGVCLGCPVKVSQSASLPVGQCGRSKPANRQTGKPANYTYKMVCKDGPVFDAEEIVW